MKPFILSIADRIRQREWNTDFPIQMEIKSAKELERAALWDNMVGLFRNNYRADENLLSTDCIGMDIDNEYTEDTEKWITPEILAERLQGIQFYTVYSRNHMKDKYKKTGELKYSARPRFHVYFPLSETFTKSEDVSTLKQDLRKIMPDFDAQALDTSRQLYGVINPVVSVFEGEKFIDVFVHEYKEFFNTFKAIDETKANETTDDTETENDEWDKLNAQYGEALEGENPYVGQPFGTPIPEKWRHKTLICYAVGYTRNYTLDEARELYDKRIQDCTPPMTDAKEKSEIENIWKWAVSVKDKPYRKKAKIEETHSETKETGTPKDEEKNTEMKEAEKTSSETKEQTTETEKKEGKKKKPKLTLPFLEREMQVLNVSIRLNVITKDVEVSDMPLKSKLIPDSYKKANASTRRQANKDMLPLFLQNYLEARGYTFKDGFLKSALNCLAVTNRFNPFADMLNNTKWDGTKRIAELFKAMGLTGDEHKYDRQFFAKWLVQVIAMALNDDAELANEFVLTLQGNQGIGKTSVFRKLAMRIEWFKEGASIDTTNKDNIMECTNVLICELGELDTTLAREQSSLKAFLNRRDDTYRVPYGEKAIQYERRTTFCATVNPDEFLRDPTGSRRFVVIPVECIDMDYVLNTMTPEYVRQLWAEVHETLYLVHGRTWFYLTPDERKISEDRNAKSNIMLDGEIELFDKLAFSQPIEKWHEWTSSEIIDRLGLKISSTKLGTGLKSLMAKDKRVKKIKTMYGMRYVLPPTKTEAKEDDFLS